MFIHPAKLPPSCIIFVAGRDFSCQSKRNVNHARNNDKDKLEKGPCELGHSALVLPIWPVKVNDLVQDILAFGTRHKL